MPTLTPTPVPTPTPIPTPTPSPTLPPAPLPGTLEVEPAQLYPGQTLVVRLYSPVPVLASASLNGTAVNLFPEGASNEHLGLVGIWFWSATGQQVLLASLQDALGRTTIFTTTIEVLAAEYPVENVQLLPGRESLLDPTILEEEWARVRPVLEIVTPQQLWEGPFITPTEGYVTSLFGTMRSYNGGPPSEYHNGLDIANVTGTLVFAPARGRVALAAELQARGNAIILDHGWGVHSSFFHLSQILVQEGELVEKGQAIGEIGATGLVTGPHVHWEIRIGLISVDPQEWVRRTLP